MFRCRTGPLPAYYEGDKRLLVQLPDQSERVKHVVPVLRLMSQTSVLTFSLQQTPSKPISSQVGEGMVTTNVLIMSFTVNNIHPFQNITSQGLVKNEPLEDAERDMDQLAWQSFEYVDDADAPWHPITWRNCFGQSKLP